MVVVVRGERGGGVLNIMHRRICGRGGTICCLPWPLDHEYHVCLLEDRRRAAIPFVHAETESQARASLGKPRGSHHMGGAIPKLTHATAVVGVQRDLS